MNSGIYIVTCLSNKRRYIGSSKDIEYRWRKHVERLKKNTHRNRRWQNSWNKYGQENFEFAVLEIVPDETKLKEREQHWMDTTNPEFNMTPFAERPTTQGLERTPEWRDNIANGNKRYWENMPEEERKIRAIKATRPHSEDTKKLLSGRTTQAYAEGRLSRTRRPRTDQEKQNILAGMANDLERRREESARKKAEWEAGREQRELERREKISKANRGVTLTDETKEKLRQATISQFANPEAKEKHHLAMVEAMNRPEVKEKLRARPKPVYTEERRKQVGDAHRGSHRSPETIERMREARRQWWAKKKAEG